MAFAINTISKVANPTLGYIELVLDIDTNAAGVYTLQGSGTGAAGTFEFAKSVALVSGNQTLSVNQNEQKEWRAWFWRLKASDNSATAVVTI